MISSNSILGRGRVTIAVSEEVAIVESIVESILKMVLVEKPPETDKEGTMESAEASGETSTKETGTVPRPRRFLTRSSAARRKQQEAIWLAALGSMELDLVADNIPSHEALLRQLLSALEQDHVDFMV